MKMKALLWLIMLPTNWLYSASIYASNEDDPHYNAAGFFDIHVCNWPEKPPFLMALFSTTRFDEVAKVSVFTPNNKLIGELNPNQFRAFKTPSGQAKRAFITHFNLPKKAVDGWYSATVTLKNGSHYEAKDYVIHHLMAFPTGIQPAPDARDIPVTAELKWDPIPGAKYYQVFIRDAWITGTDVTASELLTEPRYLPPTGILQSGGDYVWRIHARDSNGNILLGDFNHGSLSRDMRFSVR